MTICKMCKREKCPFTGQENGVISCTYFLDKEPTRKRYTNEDMIKILRNINPRYLNAYDWGQIQEVIGELTLRASEGK